MLRILRIAMLRIMQHHGVLTVVLALTVDVPAMTIQIDYSMDTSSRFFERPEPRVPLEAAADYFGRILADELDAIVPSAENQWIARVTNPSTGCLTLLRDLSVPADTLIVYVGARDLPGEFRAQGGPGSQTVTGSLGWRQAVVARGETNTAGPHATDLAPWGGMISFDTTKSDGSPRDWHFDPGVEPEPGQDDLVSLALHELAHVLGFGLSDSWWNWVDEPSGQFTGPAATAYFGGPVDLDVEVGTPHRHWKLGTNNTATANGSIQVAIMVPVSGGRRQLTNLDIAALQDIGWEVQREVDTALVVDANGDVHFDRLDLVRVLQRGKYLTGSVATWGDGDWNCDGQFDQLDVMTALNAGPQLGCQPAVLETGWSAGRASSLIVADLPRQSDVVVPEPSAGTLALWLLLVPTLRFCRHRDRVE